MKKILMLGCVLIGFIATAQVKIGDNTTTVGTSSALELESTNKALLVTRVPNPAAITEPVNGMLIFDLSSNCFRGYANGVWSGCFGVTTSICGTLAALNCASATIKGTLQKDVAASGVSAAVPYTGGNGGTYGGQTAISVGVTGLTATLISGTFATGNGSVTYTITGTPAATGTATFALNTGGQTCSLAIIVN